MILQKLQECLDSHQIKYVVMSHSQAYTAQEIAMLAHLPGKELAKTVMVKMDGKIAMAVVPASDMVDFKLLKKSTGAREIVLASEKEFKDLFPACEVGAMPPFGNLFGIEVFAAESLAEDQEIVFNAGTHSDLVRLAWKDFERLVQPKIMKLSVRRKGWAEENWKFE